MIRYQLKDGMIDSGDIKKFISTHSAALFREFNAYYEGKNSYIQNREIKDIGAPDNRIAVPYGRKIVNSIVGYMYRPGLISYQSENENFKDKLDDIFYYNNEPLKSSKAGRMACINGVAYELHYIDKDTIPRFSILDPAELIPIYDYSIEPELIAAIRFYTINDVTFVDVYYENIIVQYKDTKERLEFLEEKENIYGMVPLAVYKNNGEGKSDIEPIKSLIDAYDVLISDSMNEFDRFAWAYLVLKGLALDESDASKIKDTRIFTILQEFGDVRFLTKDVNDAFIENMKDTIREEIHKQAHVPDMTDESFAGQQSGIAIRYKLYDLENLASTKEIYFREGLDRRIDLLENVLEKRHGELGNVREIDIVMNRNIPLNITEIADYSMKLKGTVSDRTLLSQIPFVKNVDEELERISEEAQGAYAGLLDDGDDEE